MHEVGMLYSMADTATEYAEQNNIDDVKALYVEVGELAGVLPQIFTEYFPYVREKYPRLHNTEIKLHMVAGEGLCNDCHCMYNVMKQEGHCPKCSSTSKTILGGTDVRLMQLAY